MLNNAIFSLNLYKDMEKRAKEKALKVTSVVSTVGNAILAAAKIAIGLSAASMAVLADGTDSAIDVVISLVMIVAAIVVSRPPSRKYPFGLDKAESIATFILSLVIFAAGVQMLVGSLSIVLSGEVREIPGTLAIWVTVGSIVGKLLLAWYQFRVGRRVDSPLIIANAKNMRSDVMISAGVLVGLGFTYLLGMPILDALTGCLIGLFIMRTGVGIFLESGVELLDGMKDEDIYCTIFDAVAQVPQAQHPHHVRARRIGGQWMIDLDIELEGTLTVDEAHDVAERVEEQIRLAVEKIYDIEVHIEPLGFRHKREPFGVTQEMVK
jgi:cation diffusion facilitator family transporter